MHTFNPGDRVRFTKGPLGLVDLRDTSHFVERTVGVGDEGTVSRLVSNLDGWLYVDVGDELYCPVHPHLIERV
jgi:hypothetical protein